MRREGVEVLVSKNSGGPATVGKLVAARRLALPVVMVERPPKPDVETVDHIDQVLPWLVAQGLFVTERGCRRKAPRPRARSAACPRRRSSPASPCRAVPACSVASARVSTRSASSGRPTARAKSTGVEASRCAAASSSALPSCQGRAFEIGL